MTAETAADRVRQKIAKLRERQAANPRDLIDRFHEVIVRARATANGERR